MEKEQIKSNQSETLPNEPSLEVDPVDPAAIKESEMAISKLVEHSESLGNSFEVLTNRLQSREERWLNYRPQMQIYLHKMTI